MGNNIGRGKNTSLSAAIDFNQDVGDNMPIIRDTDSGDFYGLVSDGNGGTIAYPLGGGSSDGTALPDATSPNDYELENANLTVNNGNLIGVVFTDSNSGAATLDINGGGALPIQQPNGDALAGGEIQAGANTAIVLNSGGTAYVLAGVFNSVGNIVREVTVTSAEILALNSTPQVVSPDIDNNPLGVVNVATVQQLVSSTIFNDFGSAAYVVNAAGVNLEYSTSGNFGGAAFNQAWGQAVADAFLAGPPTQNDAALGDLIPVAGEGLTLIAQAADPTTGDGEWKLCFEYSVIDFPV
jgi:hypothetical protein